MSRELSLAETIAMLPKEDQDRVLAGVDAEKLKYDWAFWARPEQRRLIDESFTLAILKAGRGSGKALKLSTPVPTPNGWTTMGELRRGDQVFDETGRVCQVLVAHRPYVPEKAYRLTFSDGTSLDADAEHLWVTWTHRERRQYSLTRAVDSRRFPDNWAAPWSGGLFRGKSRTPYSSYGPQVRTTAEVVETFYHGPKQELNNHCIPLAGALQLPKLALPVDPWVLGYWLGNGGAERGRVSAGSKDGEYDNDHIASMLSSIGRTFSESAPKGGCTQIDIRGLTSELRALGVLNNKHIPEDYLRASLEQRLALLRGLCDSDGYVKPPYSSVTFCSMQRGLADGVLELARSLGSRPTLREERSVSRGRDYGVAYRVYWRPTDYNPFTLPRKVRDVHAPIAQALRTRYRMITAYEPIESVPMRCITVDSPNSMYLAGEGMIPTHNTRTGCEWAREKAKREPGSRGFFVARTSADVRDVLVAGDSGILACSPPSEKPLYEPSKRLLTWPNGTTALCVSSDVPDLLRGPQAHWALADEVASWAYVPDSSGLNTWTNLRIATRLGANPQVVAMTTPKRTEFMRELLDEEGKPGVIVLHGSTKDNAANLSKTYLDVIYGLYSGTRLAQQELEGLMLDDVDGAMLTIEQIRAARVGAVPPNARLTVIGVDPSVADRPRDSCGIIVVTSTMESELYKRHAYVLEDATVHGSPEVWARKVTEVARRWGAPVIAEVNQGAALVRMTLQTVDPSVRVIEVRARYGKAVRAEPVVSAYSQGRVSHVGEFPELESEWTSWVPGETSKSPDRVDAAVWALTSLLVKQPKDLYVAPIRARSAAKKHVNTSRAGAFWNRGGRSRVGY